MAWVMVCWILWLGVLGVKKASRHRGIEASRKRRGKHPQITQITQIFLRGFLRGGQKRRNSH